MGEEDKKKQIKNVYMLYELTADARVVVLVQQMEEND